MGLTPDQIAQLVASTSQRGQYLDKFKEFMDSGEAGVNVGDTWPEFREKKVATLKQGFENAKNHKNAPAGSSDIRVILNDGQVYLVNYAAAGLSAPAVEDEDEDE